MKKAIYKSHGNAAEVIELAHTAPAPLGPGQTRVKILRAPINPSDIVQIEGAYGIQPALPAAAGLEGIGEVVEVNGEGHAAGTLVLLADPPGSWATEKVIASEALLPLPPADLDQLAMLTVNPATAYLLLTLYVDLQEGDWIIQSAANSAVGHYVTQLAKARGIRVASVVRRQSAVAELDKAGCDAAFVDGPDLAAQVAETLDHAPVLALDAVEGETFGRLASTLQEDGVAVLYGGLSGEDARVAGGLLLFKNVTVRGFWLSHWMANTPPEEQARVYTELVGLIAEGKLAAPVARVFPIEEINAALAFAMEGGRSGKVLLAPNGL